MRKVVPFSVIIWTLAALILHFSDIGQFAVWAVIASPFTWSCFCVFLWWVILVVFLTIVQAVLQVIYENSDEARIRRLFKR